MSLWSRLGWFAALPAYRVFTAVMSGASVGIERRGKAFTHPDDAMTERRTGQVKAFLGFVPVMMYEAVAYLLVTWVQPLLIEPAGGLVKTAFVTVGVAIAVLGLSSVGVLFDLPRVEQAWVGGDARD